MKTSPAASARCRSERPTGPRWRPRRRLNGLRSRRSSPPRCRCRWRSWTDPTGCGWWPPPLGSGCWTSRRCRGHRWRRRPIRRVRSRVAELAAPLSPVLPEAPVEQPGDGVDVARRHRLAPLGVGGGRALLDPVVGGVGDVEVAGRVERQPCGPSSRAEVAAPPSPLCPRCPRCSRRPCRCRRPSSTGPTGCRGGGDLVDAVRTRRRCRGRPAESLTEPTGRRAGRGRGLAADRPRHPQRPRFPAMA